MCLFTFRACASFTGDMYLYDVLGPELDEAVDPIQLFGADVRSDQQSDDLAQKHSPKLNAHEFGRMRTLG